MDSATIISKIDALPGALPIWYAGPDALTRSLWMLALRHRTQYALKEFPGQSLPQFPRSDLAVDEQGWLHAAASLVEWSSTHLQPEASMVPPLPRTTPRRKGRQPRTTPRNLGEKDVMRALDLALQWYPLSTVRGGLKSGDMSVARTEGRHIFLKTKRRPEVEVLDMLLEQVTVVDPPDNDSEPEQSAIDRWFRTNAGRPERIHQIPESIRREAWGQSLERLRTQGISLDEQTDLGGLTLAAARSCFAVLLAHSDLNVMATFHLQNPNAVLWAVRPENLRRLLAAYVSVDEADAFIDMCCYSTGRSPASSPLVPHGDLLLIPRELLSPIAYERTLLRAATADPGRGGRLGNALGDRSSRWRTRLETLPGCMAAERVKVKHPDGRLAGDLDVVAWDAVAQRGLVLETKWPVDAQTLSESNKVDRALKEGREQAARLRRRMQCGEVNVEWPRGWSIPKVPRLDWWVASAQQLDSTEAAAEKPGEVGTTSLRLVEHLLPQPGLSELIDALSSPPLPVEGVDYEMTDLQVELDGWTVHSEAINLLNVPAVPADRRTSRGWT